MNKINIAEVMRIIVSLPSPRYWCSESQAIIEMKYRINGNHSEKKSYPERKRMYDSIYNKYIEEKKIRPNDTLGEIIFDIVNSPAPESFISATSANIILNRHKKKIRLGEIIDSPCQHQLFVTNILLQK